MSQCLDVNNMNDVLLLPSLTLTLTLALDLSALQKLTSVYKK